jgi:hypothetical protein
LGAEEKTFSRKVNLNIFQALVDGAFLEESMDELVHANIWSPHTSLFKSARNDRAECQTIRCSNKDNCGLFSRGECCWISGIGWHKCKYGKYSKEEGFTRRARKYSDWISARKKQYDGIPRLKGHTQKLAIVGDLIFLPYAHMNMIEGLFETKSSLFVKGSAFIPKEEFTPETIFTLINFRPQAMMGGEIESYQKNHILKFILHLSEEMPKLWEDTVKKFPELKERLMKVSHIGRKAKLRSIVPNAGKLKDIHGGLWLWDGEYLTSTNSKISFALVSEFEEARLKPEGNPEIKITDDSQVTSNTEFID